MDELIFNYTDKEYFILNIGDRNLSSLDSHWQIFFFPQIAVSTNIENNLDTFDSTDMTKGKKFKALLIQIALQSKRTEMTVHD